MPWTWTANSNLSPPPTTFLPCVLKSESLKLQFLLDWTFSQTFGKMLRRSLTWPGWRRRQWVRPCSPQRWSERNRDRTSRGGSTKNRAEWRTGGPRDEPGGCCGAAGWAASSSGGRSSPGNSPSGWCCPATRTCRPSDRSGGFLGANVTKNSLAKRTTEEETREQILVGTLRLPIGALEELRLCSFKHRFNRH